MDCFPPFCWNYIIERRESDFFRLSIPLRKQSRSFKRVELECDTRPYGSLVRRRAGQIKVCRIDVAKGVLGEQAAELGFDGSTVLLVEEDVDESCYRGSDNDPKEDQSIEGGPLRFLILVFIFEFALRMEGWKHGCIFGMEEAERRDG